MLKLALTLADNSSTMDILTQLVLFVFIYLLLWMTDFNDGNFD